MPALFAELVVLVLAGVVGYNLGRGSSERTVVDAAESQRLREENVALRGLVGRLKDLAWDHRELDSALSTILIDEIRTYERKQLGP
jgi:hypothetical protein